MVAVSLKKKNTSIKPTSPIPNDEKIVLAEELISRLSERGHVHAPAAWGIFKLIERAFLQAESNQIRVVEESPSICYVEPGGCARFVKIIRLPGLTTMVYQGIPPDDIKERIANQPPAKEHEQLDAATIYTDTVLLICSTPALWDWWKSAPQASLVCPRSELPADHEQGRLEYDKLTLTITLDGVHYTPIHTISFIFFQAIASAEGIMTSELLQSLPGCKGKRPGEYIKKLPAALSDCIQSKAGEGYHLELPHKNHKKLPSKKQPSKKQPSKNHKKRPPKKRA